MTDEMTMSRSWPRALLSRGARWGWGFVAATLLLAALKATATHIKLSALSERARETAGVVEDCFEVVMALFPGFLAEWIPVAASHFGFRTAFPIDEVMQTVGILPLSFATGFLLYEAGQRFGWKRALSGYVLLSFVGAAISADIAVYMIFGDTVVHEWARNLFQ